MSMKHSGGFVLYRDYASDSKSDRILFVFRKVRRAISDYGLQIDVPHPPVPLSALATVGSAKVLKNITAAATTSSIRFTIVFSLFGKSNRDTFMCRTGRKHYFCNVICSEFVTGNDI